MIQLLLTANGICVKLREVLAQGTPLHARVALLKREYEAALIGKIPIEVNNVHNLWDKEVLNELKKSSSSSV